jgi:hypothetical protein
MKQRESRLSRNIQQALRATEECLIIELAWAAGFFDGEGTCYIAHHAAKAKPRLAIGQIDDFVLLRFRSAVGELGTVNGPYIYKKRPKATPHYLYTCNGYMVPIVTNLLWPYLSPVKKIQIQRVLDETTGK